jgi:hypothetical protein
MATLKRFFRLTFLVLALVLLQNAICFSEVLRYHTLVLDGENKIVPWYTPAANAYDQYLEQLWKYIATVPTVPHLPYQCIFYTAGSNPALQYRQIPGKMIGVKGSRIGLNSDVCIMRTHETWVP